MRIKTLLHDFVDNSELEKFGSYEVSNITNDSRDIVADTLFLAEQGISSHGLDYLTLEQAEKATVIAYQPNDDIEHIREVFAGLKDKFIAIPNLNQHVSEIAQRFYVPRFSKGIVGITGTNGKTSIANFIAQLSGYGVIGTMGYGRLGQLKTLSHTTPNALLLQSILKDLSCEVDGVAMEVSSHAMALHRVDAVNFDTAVFSNLTQDHLDFHASMEDYFQEKAKLFSLDCVNHCIINADDNYGKRLAVDLQEQGKDVIVYGHSEVVKTFEKYALIERRALSAQGIVMDLQLKLSSGVNQPEAITVSAPVWGGFNAHNLLAAMLSVYVSDKEISWAELAEKAKSLHGVTGRIEAIDLGSERAAIVDYAHTPDALVNVLQSLREHCKGRIFTVFGCGGDRDSSKRPLMAEAVNAYSDFGIISDDNPRTEDSEKIIADILTGDIDRNRFDVVPCRREAIRFGLEKLQTGDVLLIAGKGHETYQIIGTEKTDFSDHEEVKRWLEENS